MKLEIDQVIICRPYRDNKGTVLKFILRNVTDLISQGETWRVNEKTVSKFSEFVFVSFFFVEMTRSLYCFG